MRKGEISLNILGMGVWGKKRGWYSREFEEAERKGLRTLVSLRKGAREGEDIARTRTEVGSGGVNSSPSSRIFSQ